MQKTSEQQQQREEQHQEFLLILRLLEVQEPIEESENAQLLLDRAVFHFMRNTTLRRSSCSSSSASSSSSIVAEEEIEASLQVADRLFVNPSMLQRSLENDLSSSSLQKQAEGEEGEEEENEENSSSSSSSSTVSSAVCVILDELLCFLDVYTTSSSPSSSKSQKQDPPSFNVKRINSATKFLQRLSVSSTSSQRLKKSAIIREIFQQTLPGVISRSCAFLNKTFNSSASFPTNKPDRESCVALLELIRVHLNGCDFPFWLDLPGSKNNNNNNNNNNSNAQKQEQQQRQQQQRILIQGVSAYVRSCKLLSTVLDAFQRFVEHFVNSGGMPVPSSSSSSYSSSFSTGSSTTLSSWFNNSIFRHHFGSKLTDLLLFVLSTFSFSISPSSSSSSSSSLSKLEETQKETMIKSQKVLIREILKSLVLSNRWLVDIPSTKRRVGGGGAGNISLLLQLNRDEICFDPQQQNQEQRKFFILRSIMLHDAVSCFLDDDDDDEQNKTEIHKEEKKNQQQQEEEEEEEEEEKEILPSLAEKTRPQRVLRQFISAISQNLKEQLYPQQEEEQDENQRQKEEAGDHLLSVNTSSSSRGASNYNSSSSSSSSSFSLCPFEKWLISDSSSHSFASSSSSSSSFSFLMIALRESCQRREFFTSSAQDGDDEQNLISLLETQILPLLDDPFEYSKHHALLLILMQIIQCCFFSFAAGGDENNEEEKENHKNKKKEQRKKLKKQVKKSLSFLDSLLFSDLFEPLWQGVILSGDHIRQVSKNWKKCNSSQKRFRASLNALISRFIASIGCGLASSSPSCLKTQQEKFPESVDRFLILALRELLDIASTDCDFENVASEGAMASLKLIASAFFGHNNNNNNAFSCSSATSHVTVLSENNKHDASDNNNNKSETPLYGLLRHCISPVVDVTIRELKDNTSSASSSSSGFSKLLSNARILYACALLCVKQTQNSSSSSSSSSRVTVHNKTERQKVLSDLAPTVLPIALCCCEILRNPSSFVSRSVQRRGADDESEDEDEETTSSSVLVSLRSLVFKISLAVAEFTKSAQRLQDLEWKLAASDALLDRQQRKEKKNKKKNPNNNNNNNNNNKNKNKNNNSATAAASSSSSSSADPEMSSAMKMMMMMEEEEEQQKSQHKNEEQNLTLLEELQDQDPEGNIIRLLYKTGKLKRPADSGQIKLLTSDNEWMDSEDFNAFCDPLVTKLHETLIQILSCAVSGLGTQFSVTPSASSSSSASSSNASLLLLERKQNKSTTMIENHEDEKRWSVISPASSSSSSSSSSSLALRQKEEARKFSKQVSVAERVSAIKLCVSCLCGVSTSTPVSYFEASCSSSRSSTNSETESEKQNSTTGTLTTVEKKEEEDDDGDYEKKNLRISRGHWTSVFKVFHALQSVLISSRISATSGAGFRSISEAVHFFHRTVSALVNYRRIVLLTVSASSNSFSSETSCSSSSSSPTTTAQQKQEKEKSVVRIELRSCFDQLNKKTQLLADESIAQVPSACCVLASLARSFLLFRMQTEVLPLLALQWLAIVHEKEPEVWSSQILSSPSTNENDNNDNNNNNNNKVAQPRTLLGKNFKRDVLKLMKECDMMMMEKKTENQQKQEEEDGGTENRCDADVQRVVEGLKVLGIFA